MGDIPEDGVELDLSKVEAPGADEQQKLEVPPDDGIEALKAKLEAEKRRADGEAAARREAEARASEASGRAQASDLGLVTNAIEMVKQQQGALKAGYADAMANGDWAAAAELQLQIAQSAANMLELERGQQRMKEHQTRVEADPVEQLARQLTPASAAWVRAHPEYARDERLNRRMIRAHEDAVDDGLSADTPEYFAAVEARLGLTKKPEPEPEPSAEAAQVTGGRRAAPPAAPVSRATTPSGATARPGTMRLSKDEAEAAEMSGLTPEEYWAQKQRINKEQGRVH